MSEIKACPYAKKCGGCVYSDTTYAEQLEIKNGIINKYLGAVAKECGIKPEAIVGAKEPFYYRNKVHSVFARNKKGQIIRGIYRRDSHEVVPVSGCLLEDKKADAIIEEIKRLVPSFKYRIYDENSRTGWLRHVLVRMGSCGGKEEIMVILVTADVAFPGKNNFVKALRGSFPEITTIVQNINKKRTSMVLGDRDIVIYGKGFIEDDRLGLKFRISPGSFFQINSGQTVKLYGLALEFAGLKGKERVLDAYCGTGTIGMFLSKKAAKVTGVELNPDAVRDARENSKRNGIVNIEFICVDATKYMQEKAENCFDVLCMDPPRSGSTPEFIKAAARLEIGRVVYVSCNPETLARDVKLFMKLGYRLKRLVPVDMFPLTDNCECCALLEKEGN